jgi:excisionase family DNA binding protein
MKARNQLRPEHEYDGANWLTTGQIATRLGVSSRLVAKWIDTGKLIGFRLPYSKDRRVHADVLAEFEEAHGFNRARGRKNK